MTRQSSVSLNSDAFARLFQVFRCERKKKCTVDQYFHQAQYCGAVGCSDREVWKALEGISELA
eukprot:scaffold154681_cov53-Attheya_sp.AAC.1